jgi:hypothetical protein
MYSTEEKDWNVIYKGKIKIRGEWTLAYTKSWTWMKKTSTKCAKDPIKPGTLDLWYVVA